MHYNHTIVEVAANQYVLARQNKASEFWSCGDVHSTSCLGAALLAAKNNLTTIYPAVECATRALFDLYSEEAVAGNISFASALDAKAQNKDQPAVVWVASSDRRINRANALPKLEF